jgi:hypothetical protein
MKVKLWIWAWGLSLLLCGGLMAEEISQEWVTIKDQKTGLQVDFPRKPLEMSFETPFQNTPPEGQIHLYSAPMPSGILVASTFTSNKVSSDNLQKKALYQFFESILVPHFFFNPAVFNDQQVFTYEPKLIAGHPAASFHFSFHDHSLVKRLEGIAMVKKHTLYVYFYLASEHAFDTEVLNRFLHSVK